MHKLLIHAGIIGILVLGVFAALPQDTKACTGPNCGPFTQTFQKKWKDFKCPDFRTGGMSGILDSRYRASSPKPGCADKVRVEVKCGACYQITLNGKYDYNCDASSKNSHQWTDALFQMPNGYNGNKIVQSSKVVINGQSIRQIDSDVNTNYSTMAGNHSYTFHWKAPVSDDPNKKTTLDMYIKEYNGGNYIDNKGHLNYSIQEVDCNVCPNLK